MGQVEAGMTLQGHLKTSSQGHMGSPGTLDLPAPSRMAPPGGTVFLARGHISLSWPEDIRQDFQCLPETDTLCASSVPQPNTPLRLPRACVPTRPLINGKGFVFS